MKKITTALLAFALCACQYSSERELAQENSSAENIRTLLSNTYDIQTEKICADLDFDIYAITSGNNPDIPVMVIGGTNTKLYACDPDGKEWFNAMTAFCGNDLTIRSIATGSGKFSNRWMAAADHAILYTVYNGGDWVQYKRDNDLVFQCVGVNLGRTDRTNVYYFGAEAEDGPHLFEYTFWDDGASAWTDFREIEPGVDSRFTAITGTTEHVVYGVTQRGEFIRIGSVGEENRIFFPSPLNAAKVYWKTLQDYGGIEPVVYVAGENGFMAKIRNGAWISGGHDFSVEVLNTGVRHAITCIAVEGSVYTYHETEPMVLAGGPDGLLILSTDGRTFEKIDIGFEGDIRDIAWHQYTESFFVVGGHGEIHEVKITPKY